MKLLEKRESHEVCTEAGWMALDYVFDKSVEQALIEGLRPLGDFLYLRGLKEPFFKSEGHHRLIKGIQGQCFFRVAVHMAHKEEWQEVDDLIDNLLNEQ